MVRTSGSLAQHVLPLTFLQPLQERLIYIQIQPCFCIRFGTVQRLENLNTVVVE